MTTTTYVDANQHHDQVTGRAVTECLHLVNVTPSHWHTKRQATVETATFGSEFVEQELLQIKLLTSGTHSCILEFQSGLKSYIFGDNKCVVDSVASLHLPYQRNQL